MGRLGVDADAVLWAELAGGGISDLSDLDAADVVALTKRYGIWLPVDTYTRAPWIAPYAIRRLRNRTDARAPGPKRDLWGMPDEQGYFADDNSLIKGVVKNLPVLPLESPYEGNGIDKGLVCCHVWPATTDNPLLFSFVPNLVWLPRSLAGYSDAHFEGPPHEVHEVLKAAALRRYRARAPQFGRIRSESAWGCLAGAPVEPTGSDVAFDAGDRVVSLAHRRIRRMIDFLEATLVQGAPPQARFSKRYHAGFGPGIDRSVWSVQKAVSPAARQRLVGELRSCLAPSD